MAETLAELDARIERLAREQAFAVEHRNWARDAELRGEIEKLQRRRERLAHHCHARGCPTHVPPSMLMCLKHWRMVPEALKREVWRTHVRGQEVRKDPTPEYLRAADAAIRAVAEKEARQPGQLRLKEPRDA